MVRLQRVARARGGKIMEAVQFAKEVAGHLNAKYGVTIQVYAELFGEVNRVFWDVDFKDLAAFEALNAQLLADQAYWGIVRQGVDLFIEGSIHDTVMMST